MGLLTSFSLSSSGLAVQQKRLDVAAENLANMNSTRTPEGGPYKEKEVVVSSMPLGFDEGLTTLLKKDVVQGAAITQIIQSNKPARVVYDPSHPDADPDGNVSYPNISGFEQMIDIQTASKAYEANVTVFNSAKTMMMRTLDLGGV